MIRYDTDHDKLQAAVAALEKPLKPGGRARRKAPWLVDAAARTAAFKKAGYYNEAKGNWTPVKSVYFALQFNKCAYCERALEAKKEMDIEHFRPKSALKDWPVPADLDKEGIKPVKVKPDPTGKYGYYLLPYHLLNYSMACARCNSDLKSNMFPIAGTHDLKGVDPVAMLKKEKPYLICPVGRWDDDPEDLIDFFGIVPMPKKKKGTMGYKRARITIAFFKLDDRNYRRELFRARAEAIVKIGITYELMLAKGTGAAMKASCKRVIDSSAQSVSQHAACCRAYIRMWKTTATRENARTLFTDSQAFLDSMSPARPDPR